MVVLDLKMAQSMGLSSRQASLVGAGDFRREKSKMKKASVSTNTDSEENSDNEENSGQNKGSISRQNTNGSVSMSRSSSNLSRAVRKASHLYLQDKNITRVSPQISKLKNLKVLYLYDNKLESAETLYYAQSLSHVYLMNNELRSTRGFSKLRNLEKLYLSGNKIEVVEDLILNPLEQDYDPKLKELHLESQNLPPGHSLIFDPQCLSNLAYSLQVLNISSNNITSVEPILETCHKSLDKFYASNNNIKTLDLNEKITFPYLSVVHLKGNPMQKKLGSKKYRQKLVVTFSRLRDLDNQEISNFERKWHESFSAQMKKRQAFKLQQSKSVSEETQNINHDQNQPKYYQTNGSTSAENFNITRQDSMINFGTESADNLLTQKLSSQSTLDLAPPVPEHWRKKGLPGGRNQFDRILEKARVSAHERILKQTSRKQLNLLEANKKFESGHGFEGQAGDFDAQNLNTKREASDFQSKLREQQAEEDEVVNEEMELERKILNLSAMKLAPMEDYRMQGDN